jgi:hypothetical protein
MCKCLWRSVAWTVIGVAPLPLWAAGAAPQPVLQVQVYNLAHVGSKDLARAEQEVTIIFAHAGIIISWREGSVQDKQELATDFSVNGALFGSCIAANEMPELKLRLLRGTPPNTLPGALGYALPCAKFGVTVTIFVDRCEEVMSHNMASLPKILGHAMAHEIGHVLLGSNEHSDSGIMRSRWTKADWFIVAAGHMTFLEGQVERMRGGLSIASKAGERAEAR